VHARFLATGTLNSGGLVSLPADEAAHLTRVLRLGAGARVRVFDGRGHEYDGVVEHADRHRVAVRLGDPLTPAPEAPVAVTLVQAVLKGDKMDDVVRDAVMMGVTAIQPVTTVRTEVAYATRAGGGRRERWARIALASAKQCGRAVVPEVRDTRLLDEVWDSLPTRRLMLVEPSAAGAVMPAALPRVETAPVAIVVGPEGGWAPAELSAAASRSTFVALGGRTLRADAAATVAMAALFAVWDAF
jgi:16S rRNA (uracil1498-N3)-methyltransferase